MTEADSYRIADSIHVAASPGAVHDVVPHVTRTGEWSPICVRCVWEDADGDGTRLTETWAFPEHGRDVFRERYGDAAEQEIAIRLADARSGIPVTLEAIRKIVEAG